MVTKSFSSLFLVTKLETIQHPVLLLSLAKSYCVFLSFFNSNCTHMNFVFRLEILSHFGKFPSKLCTKSSELKHINKGTDLILLFELLITPVMMFRTNVSIG